MGSNPQPPDHQSDAHPTEPPRPAILYYVGAWGYTLHILVNLLSQQTNADTFANRIDPDETALMSRLIRIYTVCYSILIFDWNPYWEQWFWPDSKLDESTLETQGWKRQSNVFKLTDRQTHEYFSLSIVSFESGTVFPTRLHMRTAKTQISLRIRSVWSASSQSILWVAKNPYNLQMDREDSDQPALGSNAIL